MFPAHKAGLHLQHNNHKNYYESVETYFKSPWMDDTGLSAEERQKMIDTDEVWELQWYPNTPVGSYCVTGSTFEEVLRRAKEI